MEPRPRGRVDERPGVEKSSIHLPRMAFVHDWLVDGKPQMKPGSGMTVAYGFAHDLCMACLSKKKNGLGKGGAKRKLQKTTFFR